MDNAEGDGDENDNISNRGASSPHRTRNGQRDMPGSSTASTERTPLLQPARTPEQSRSKRYRRKTKSALQRCCCCSSWTALGIWATGLILAILLVVLLTAGSSSVVLHLLSSLGSLSTCSTCFSLLVPIRQLALLGDTAFTNAFTNLCIDLRIQPEEICRGAIGRQAPVIAQSLRQIQPNKRTAAALCTKLFGLCSARGESIPDWPAEYFPAPNITRSPRPRSGRIRKVVHISDLHIDRLYKVGSEGLCGEVLCCRNSSTSLTDSTKPNWPAGPFGHPHCDTPFSLFRSMLDGIARVAGDAAFVVSTGDIPSHAVWEDSRETASPDILEVYAIMRSVLKIPVFGAIGNHDIAPVNLFPRSSNTKLFAATQWVYDLHYDAWRDWIGNTISRAAFTDTVGSYAIRAPGMDVKVISINTNFWSPDNFYLFDTDYPASDPEGILGFLMRELQSAESQGLKAIIIGHAPPTTIFPAQSHYLDQIIQRYRSTIIAQLFGHTHVSDFLVSYSTPAIKTPETASAIGFASGALTPFGGMINPGFRVYEVDEITGEIWDYKDYYANITDPSFKHGPEWRILYSAREEYGPLIPDSQGKPLDPAFWHSVSNAIENSTHIFRKYIYNKYRGSKWGTELACRTPQCHNRVICNLRRSRSEDRCLAGVNSKQVGINNEEEALDPEESSPAAEANAQKFGMQQLLQGIMDKAKRGELTSVDVKGITKRRGSHR